MGIIRLHFVGFAGPRVQLHLTSSFGLAFGLSFVPGSKKKLRKDLQDHVSSVERVRKAIRRSNHTEIYLRVPELPCGLQFLP